MTARGVCVGIAALAFGLPALAGAQPPVTPAQVAGALDAPTARDAIARVAYAEAGNQGDSGLAGVVYTVINRLQDGRWGSSVDAVLDAPHQFEPVMRAGGDWRRLPEVSEAARARIDTILNLAMDGRLPDLTGGARYFQNVAIVRARAKAGLVSPERVGFGGAQPSAVIGAHTFYAAAGHAGGGVSGRARNPAGDAILIASPASGPATARVAPPASGAGATALAGPRSSDILIPPGGQ